MTIRSSTSTADQAPDQEGLTGTTTAGWPASGENNREDPIGETGREAAETAGRLIDRATQTTFQVADRGREQTASGLQQLAGQMRRASTELESAEGPISNIAEIAAEQTQRAAEFLRTTDARQMVHGIERMARQQPILFLGGAFLAGFAASRFLKASTAGSSGESGHGTYRQGRYQATGPGGERLGEGA